MSSDLDKADPNSTIDVIVQFAHPLTPADDHKVAKLGGTPKLGLDSVRAGVYSMPAKQLATLAADSAVKFISPDRPVHPTAFEYAPSAINAEVAWTKRAHGRGIGVAVIDSGIDPANLDVAGARLVYQQSFAPSDHSPIDKFGHGTHIAGLEAAWKAGIVVVVAAGNEGRNNTFETSGYGLIASPGNDPYVITVGSMRTMGTPTRADDLIASYSSKGPTAIDHFVKPDLLAPGNQVASALASNGTFVTVNALNGIPLSDYAKVSMYVSTDPNSVWQYPDPVRFGAQLQYGVPAFS